jgi:hypothetical protein
MGLRKIRIRRLVILAALILLAAGSLWFLQSSNSEGGEGIPSPEPVAEPEVSETDRIRQVLTLGLGAINCARINNGLNEVNIDRALTQEAVQRLEALRSTRRGDEYETMVQGSEIKSLYRVVFLSALDMNACSLPWFSVAEGKELAPLENPDIKKAGLAGAPDGNRMWIMITWR